MGSWHFLAAYAASFILGWRFLRALLGPREPLPAVLVLAPAAGLALSSFLLLAQLLMSDQMSLGRSLVLHGVLLGLIEVIRLRVAPAEAGAKVDSRLRGNDIGAAAVMSIAAVLFLARALKSPYGTGLDAWAIWKLKARFLFYAENWKDVFSPILDFSHPDYPLFYPLAMVWGWFFGGESAAAPFLLSMTATVCLAGFMVLSAGRAGLAAGLLLAATPHFIGSGASQYADIWTAFFSLAALVFADRAFRSDGIREALAAGFFAGAGCLVKNEGLLFYAVLAAVWMFRGKRRIALIVASLPFVIAALCFKMAAATPSHILSWEAVRGHLASGHLGARAGVVAGYFVQEVFKENAWVYAWFFFAAVFVLYARELLNAANAWRLGVLALLSGGYFLVYLFTALGLEMHLVTSFDRILLQIFPLFVYVFLSGPPFTEAARER